MSKRYLFISIFLILFTINAYAACPWPPGKVAAISTVQDLQNITSCLPAQGRTFKLVNNIDASSVIQFQQIANVFDGVFDGKNPVDGTNFKISNLQINHGGLFSTLMGPGVIQNLTLENINVQGDADPTGEYGGLVDMMMGTTARISNVSVSGKVTGNAPSYLGGLVGRIIQGTIINSSSSVTLIPGKDAKYNGVLVGWQQGGQIQGCKSSGSMILSGKTEGNGGIVGLQSNAGFTDNPLITRSSSSTKIDLTDTSSAEGNGVLAGTVGAGATINNSFANGIIAGPAPYSNVRAISGGAVGYLTDGGTLDKIYSSTTFINGDANADGGLVGLIPFSHNNISCTNSYWDKDVSELPYSSACADGGAGPRTTLEMQPDGPDSRTFVGWNTQQENDPIWKFTKGSYPTLLP